jgi:hypothetical protein
LSIQYLLTGTESTKKPHDSAESVKLDGDEGRMVRSCFSPQSEERSALYEVLGMPFPHPLWLPALLPLLDVNEHNVGLKSISDTASSSDIDSISMEEVNIFILRISGLLKPPVPMLSKEEALKE